MLCGTEKSDSKVKLAETSHYTLIIITAGSEYMWFILYMEHMFMGKSSGFFFFFYDKISSVPVCIQGYRTVGEERQWY